MNYYDVFGVSPAATLEDINSTHKALAKMYHPDINSSEGAHEKMAMLNEAYDVLSDAKKREKYDIELRQNRQGHNRGIFSAQSAEAKRRNANVDTQERAEKAELLRRKAEARLRTDEAVKKRRMEQARQKAGEAACKNRQAKTELDKQDVIKGLSAIVMGDSLKRNNRITVDEERYYATKVLLSMVRKDEDHLRRMAEEAERKQRINEILTLVNEYNNKKEWV